MDQIVLVTGATGFIGRSVVHKLLESGYRVRALSRSATPNGHDLRMEHAVGDMRDIFSLEKAMAGVSYVVHLAAAKNDEKESEAINVDGAHNLIEACRIAGVKRIVNVSTQSTKLKYKGAYGSTKERADFLFHTSGLEVVTLRSSLVYGDREEGILGTIARYAALPAVPMVGQGDIRFRPIHRDDLASIIVASMSSPAVGGKVYDVGGPNTLSLLDITKKIMAAIGAEKRIVHIPLGLALLLARATSFLKRPPLTVSNVLGSMEDVPVDIHPLRRDLGDLPMRGFDEGLKSVFPPLPDPHAIEAAILLKYVLSSVSRYVPATDEIERCRAAIEAHGLHGSVIPKKTLRSHMRLGMVDVATKMKHPESIFQKKLLITAAVAEAQPISADYLLPRAHSVLGVFFLSIDVGISALVKTICAIPLMLSSSLLSKNAGNL